MKAILNTQQRNALIEFIGNMLNAFTFVSLFNNIIDAAFMVFNWDLMMLMPNFQKTQLSQMLLSVGLICVTGSYQDAKDYIYKDIL